MRYEVIYESEDLVALNKPAGLLTIPDRHDSGQPSLLSLLRQRYDQIFVVHRIDKFTSGLILFARTAEMHRHLSLAFEARKILKSYTGIVYGRMPEPEGVITAAIAENPARKGEMLISGKGKPAVTGFTVLKTTRFFLLSAFVRKPRTHQIRVHAQYINHPYFATRSTETEARFLSQFKRDTIKEIGKEERPLLSRLALHASAITFTDNSGKSTLKRHFQRICTDKSNQETHNKINAGTHLTTLQAIPCGVFSLVIHLNKKASLTGISTSFP